MEKIKGILSINDIMLVLTLWLGETMFYLFGQSIDKFEIWQPFTSMWMHGGILHFAINMFVLWSFANTFSKWSNKKFMTMYLLSGLAGSLLSLPFQYAFAPEIVAVGASGAICGVLGAFAVMNPKQKVYLFFIIPANVKKTVWWFGGISLFLALTNLMPGIGHAAHLGGLVCGYGMAEYWKRRNKLYTTKM